VPGRRDATGRRCARPRTLLLIVERSKARDARLEGKNPAFEHAEGGAGIRGDRDTVGGLRGI
jgi:hypothetical protein